MFKGAMIKGVLYPVTDFELAKATFYVMGLNTANFGGKTGDEIFSKDLLRTLGLYSGE